MMGLFLSTHSYVFPMSLGEVDRCIAGVPAKEVSMSESPKEMYL